MTQIFQSTCIKMASNQFSIQLNLFIFKLERLYDGERELSTFCIFGRHWSTSMDFPCSAFRWKSMSTGRWWICEWCEGESVEFIRPATSWSLIAITSNLLWQDASSSDHFLEASIAVSSPNQSRNACVRSFVIATGEAKSIDVLLHSQFASSITRAKEI